MASQVSLLRLFALAGLLAFCTFRLYDCFKLPGMGSSKSKTPEEKAEEERWQAARKAYKELFVRSGKYTTDEIFEKLKAMDNYYDRPDIDMPIDVRLLMRYNETLEENCDDMKFIKEFKANVKRTRKEARALHDYLEGTFARQLELCDYENRFKRVVEQFMQNEPGKWQLIQEYNYAVGLYGTRNPDYKGKMIDNEFQMNEALEHMFDEKIRLGHFQGHEITMKAYTLAREVKEACQAFAGKVGTSLMMTTINSKAVKQNEEILDWLRYLNVCEQVERVNYERAIGRMFNNQHVPGFNDVWDQYLGYREMWV